MVDETFTPSYAVAWQDGHRAPLAGKLELHADGIRLESGGPDGRLTVLALRYDGLSSVRMARGRERLSGRPTLLLERATKPRVAVAGLGAIGTSRELAERLGACLRPLAA